MIQALVYGNGGQESERAVMVLEAVGQDVRQVEIIGNDAAELVQLMTCRDLSKSKVGRCYYCPIIDQDGKMVNDPVVLKFQNLFSHFKCIFNHNHVTTIFYYMNFVIFD